MKRGTVKFFNRKSKFGFIKDDETGQEYYVHIKDTKTPIDEGDRVEFELKDLVRGPAAINVTKIQNP
ncbi:MAG: cold shock domain-containing protein [Bacteroidetes bacterium]|jgi:CspA family cold shock protein|nr:cold shock domain-containing protein [Bacteroidota bacterium]